jgi:hypothetical protein
MLKFLTVVIVVFFVFRILGRMFVVSSFNSMGKRMQDEMNRRQQKPEGQVTIDPGVNKKKNNDDHGEYTDYEEVK